MSCVPFEVAQSVKQVLEVIGYLLLIVLGSYGMLVGMAGFYISSRKEEYRSKGYESFMGAHFGQIGFNTIVILLYAFSAGAVLWMIS